MTIYIQAKIDPYLPQEDQLRELVVKYLEDRESEEDRKMLMNAISNQTVDHNAMQMLFFEAAARGDVVLISPLINAQVDVNTTDSNGWTPIMFAAMYDETGDMTRLLCSHKANIHDQNAEGQTPLLIAAKYGRAHLIDILMQYGSDSTHVDNDGWTALMLAANGSNTKVVQQLLKYCSSEVINHQNSLKLTALKIAAYNKNYFNLCQLILKGAYFNEPGDGQELSRLILLGRIEITVQETDEDIVIRFQDLVDNLQYFCMPDLP